MDNESLQRIKDQLFSKKTQDYTNLTFFFLIFSIFTFFVIRPSLTTAFTLQTQEAQLKEIEVKYEEVVSKIPEIQAALEEVRPDRPVLAQALPQTPNLNNILQDIRSGGEEAGISIIRMNVSDVNLVGATSSALMKKLIVELETTTTYDKFVTFQQIIHSQRRLKKIKSFEILKEGAVASGGGNLKIKVQVEGYFL